MKFKEFEYGKKYTREGDLCLYESRNSLLFNLTLSRYSPLSMNDVWLADFTEIPQYVTFEEAIEHMKNGGLAQHLSMGISKPSNPLHVYIYIFDNALQFYDKGYNDVKPIIFNMVLLEPKWILL